MNNKITAEIVLIKKIKSIKNRDKKNQIWSYEIDLKNENYCFTMRIPPEQWKVMKKISPILENEYVKVLVCDNSVCALFNSEGLGFMFTNVPFEINK